MEMRGHREWRPTWARGRNGQPVNHSAVLVAVSTTVTAPSVAISPHHLLCDVVFIVDCEYNRA